MIVAAVVENSDTVSKKASTYDGILPDKKNARVPKRDANIHPKVTIARPFFAFIFDLLMGIFVKMKPVRVLKVVLIAKCFYSQNQINF